MHNKMDLFVDKVRKNLRFREEENNTGKLVNEYVENVSNCHRDRQFKIDVTTR